MGFVLCALRLVCNMVVDDKLLTILLYYNYSLKLMWIAAPWVAELHSTCQYSCDGICFAQLQTMQQKVASSVLQSEVTTYHM